MATTPQVDTWVPSCYCQTGKGYQVKRKENMGARILTVLIIAAFLLSVLAVALPLASPAKA